MTVALKIMLKNAMDEDKSLGKKIIKELNIAQSTLSKFVNNPDRGNDLRVALKIVTYIWPDREYELMTNYIRTLNPKKDIAKQALEYANANKLNDLFLEVLEKLELQGSEDNKEFASVYKIDWDASRGAISPFNTRTKLNKINLKYDESIAFSCIAQYYAYYDERFINEIEKMITINEEAISKLKDGFIKYSFTCRLYAMKVDVKFHKGEIEEAKENAQNAIDVVNNKDILTKMYLQLGNMNIFNGFDVSNGYLKKSLELANEMGNQHRIREAKRSINFTSNYWGKESNFLDFKSNESSDLHEVAFYHIRNSNHDKGLQMLEKMDHETLTNSQLGFHFFYRGLATKTQKYFYESLKHFNIAGEKFYKKLALIELKKLGTEDYILDSLSV